MDSTTTWLIIGGVAVAAWVGGFLTQFGFPPPGKGQNFSAAQQQIAPPVDLAPFQKSTNAKQQAQLFPPITSTGAVAYSYSGYTSAPITVS